MKKVFSLALSLALICLVFAGCGKKTSKAKKAAYDRFLFKNGLEDCVELGEYKGLSVDTASKTYKEVYDSIISEDVEKNDFYEKKTTGVVADGDTANIDYTGKKDGVAFEGGTAQGYDLEIGSGTFIPGFEDGLIGKKIGSTVDLDLTFPKEYQSADLAGKAVVFTVKINYVMPKEKQAMKPEKYYSNLNFKTVQEYYDDVKDRAIKKFLMDSVTESSKVTDYPTDDLNYLFDEQMNLINQSLQQQGADLATYLQQYGKTEKEFKTEVKSYIKSNMNTQIVNYAIFDKAKLSLKEKASDWQAEAEAVQNQVEDYLYQNASIK